MNKIQITVIVILVLLFAIAGKNHLDKDLQILNVCKDNGGVRSTSIGQVMTIECINGRIFEISVSEKLSIEK